ncbi:MAG: RcpC/CpaB family pilus assembly protein [Anaerolineales bacterium]
MRKGRVFFIIALILILGLAAVAIFYFRGLPSGTSEPVTETVAAPEVDMVEVVVVTQPTPRGYLLNETVLGTIEIPRDMLIEGYFTDLGQVVGRQARVDLDANMLLTSSMVVDSPDQLSTTGSLAALSIPRGMVAVSIPINRLSSVSYAPQPGDHVNVIATLLMLDLDTDFQSKTPNRNAAVLGAGPGVVVGAETETDISVDANTDLSKVTGQTVGAGPSSVIGRTAIDPLLEQTLYVVPSEDQRPRLVSQTLLQDAIVLGVGDFPLTDEVAVEEPEATPEPTTIEGEAGSEEYTSEYPVEAELVKEEPKLPDLITLVVNPQDAVTLNYLVYAGSQLTLALRPSGDDTRVQTEATTLDFLLTQYNIPVPVKLPYGMEPRVDDLLPPDLPNDVEPTPEQQ